MTTKKCTACGGSGRVNDSIAGDSRNTCQNCGGSGSVTDHTHNQTACFPAGTQIRMREGVLPIEQISQGDHVTAVNRNGQAVVRRVKRFCRYELAAVSKVYFSDGSCFRVTDHHTVKTCHGWVMVRDVKPGNYLVDAPTGGAESTRKITQIDRAEATEPVYNLIVEGDCTFIAEGIVAHSFTRFRLIRTAVERLRFMFLAGFVRTNDHATRDVRQSDPHGILYNH